MSLIKGSGSYRATAFFYGWVIVGITSFTMPLIYGIRNSFSVFLPPILDEFGWGRGSTALMLSLNLLIYGFVAPIAGSLGDRWKPRAVMPFGLAVVALATASCAFAQQLWHFYLLFGVLLPTATAFCGWPLLAPALANWFVRRRGLILGLGQLGGGLSFTYGVFAELTISRLGWRPAYFVLAGLLIVLVLPLYLLFFHYRPEDKGLKAYGAAQPPLAKGLSAEAAAMKNPVPADWTLGRAMTTYQLWLLVFSYFLWWGIASYLVLAHQVKFTEDAGYSRLFSASIFGLFGIFMLMGKLASSMSDWIGREKTITLAAVLSIGALAALLSVRDTSQPWLLYVYAICFGCGAGLYSPTMVAAMADLFHGRHFGAIAALLLTGMGVGGAIGPWLGGYIYDVSGSYTSAFVLCMVCLGLASVSAWMAAPRNAIRLRARVRPDPG